jgi:hypothetical protein
LLSGHGELIPDVHPVTILAINSLTTDFDLNLSDKLLTGEIQPTSIHTGTNANGEGSNAHELIDLRESNLEISAVGEITIAADHALNTTTEIGLSIECLLD